MSEESLRSKLERAKIEWPLHPNRFFVPIDDLNSLITEDSVRVVLYTVYPYLTSQEVSSLSSTICKSSKKLFALLVYLNQVNYIWGFLAEGICDSDLPLVRSERWPAAHYRLETTPFCLCTTSQSQCLKSSHKVRGIRATSSWPEIEIEKFVLHQWAFFAVVFKKFNDEIPHYDFDDSTVLPFLEDIGGKRGEWNKITEPYGSFRIHLEIQYFYEDLGLEDHIPIIAIQHPSRGNIRHFQKLTNMLGALPVEDHPHLVKLFATCSSGGKYHLMIPFSGMSLRGYWHSRPKPNFDKSTVLWSLKQMLGLAGALSRIHSRLDSNNDTPSYVNRQKEIFGVHGGLTAGNVLWYNDIGFDEKFGVLRIADCGIRLINLAGVFFKPPEWMLTLNGTFTRTYDVWSLGCLYLEFVSWLLKGSEAIPMVPEFLRWGVVKEAADRPDEDMDAPIDVDSPIRHLDPRVAYEVAHWVHGLHEEENCSALIHDLLDFIVDRVLMEAPSQRPSARCLEESLCVFVKRGEEETGYLLEPVRREHKLSEGFMDAAGIGWGQITRINKWLQKCFQEHTFCQTIGKAKMPTRVLDLECATQSHIRLFEPPVDAQGPYICLSHCWGDTSDIDHFKTTSKNLSSYKQKIDIARLTKTFREAIVVTWKLRLRYLWIDSLCIIQDDETDWARESSDMGRIFEDAYLVLAAAHSKDSLGGLLPTKEPPSMRRILPQRQHEITILTSSEEDERIDHKGRVQPLLQRAWVYQERFLARRVLFFLENELLWECASTVQCQCTPPGGDIAGWDTDCHYRCQVKDDSRVKTNSDFRLQWQQTIRRYSQLSLTRPTDKLPALSGLAKRMQASRGDQYLAGMWKSTLAEDLAWRVKKPYYKRTEPWRAPSWSWASVDGAVVLPTIKKQNCCAEAIDVYCEPSSVDPTGAVSEGSHLVLRSRVIRSLWSIDGLCLHTYPDFVTTHTATRSPDPSPCYLKIGTLDNGSYEIEYFLILEMEDGQDIVYNRVGLLQIHKDTQRCERSKIEEVEKTIEESEFEELTIT